MFLDINWENTLDLNNIVNYKWKDRRNKDSIQQDVKRNISVWVLKIMYVGGLQNGEKWIFSPQISNIIENWCVHTKTAGGMRRWRKATARWVTESGKKAKPVKQKRVSSEVGRTALPVPEGPKGTLSMVILNAEFPELEALCLRSGIYIY